MFCKTVSCNLLTWLYPLLPAKSTEICGCGIRCWKACFRPELGQRPASAYILQKRQAITKACPFLDIRCKKDICWKWDLRVQKRLCSYFGRRIFRFFSFWATLLVKDDKPWKEAFVLCLWYKKEAGIWRPLFWEPNFDLCLYGAAGGIRTLVWFPTNWFRVL